MKVLIAMDDLSILDDLVTLLHEHRWVPRTEILVLHVCEPIYEDGFYADLASYERGIKESRAAVDEVVRVLRNVIPTAQISGQVIEGDIKNEIVKTARSMPADLIVMGSHGRGLFGRMMFGSVSLAVNTEADCSVLTLRSSKKSQGHQTKQDAEQRRAAAG